jgi:hypothetical protein
MQSLPLCCFSLYRRGILPSGLTFLKKVQKKKKIFTFPSRIVLFNGAGAFYFYKMITA